MSRWLRNITLSIIAAIISITTLTGPVFATPTNPTNPDTTTTTPANPDEPSNPSTDTTEEETPEEETPEEEQAEEAVTCFDQVGGIGWLVCPGTKFLATVIDGAYNVLDKLLLIDPLPSDPKSPVVIVWDYIRDLTNLIFVCFFLFIIFSQLTGIGINNYGIKRVLPRLIIAAILINLSYIICTLAVDLSNIIGLASRDVFQNIQDTAIANGTINKFVSGVSFANIVATVLGIGTVGAASLAFTGGLVGAFWLLLPVVFSGFIAIISAVITMAARQALIFLLVMISPLAFVCYLLPNTEKWFRIWYQMFFRMIFFYPMFVVLYSASRLAGFITITSATDWLGVILGIAIQILPLFLSIPLMRMSGTVLGGIDRAVRRITDPATGLVRRRAAEGHALARARQLNSTNNIPHNRLARWLEQRRTNREFDLQQETATYRDTFLANSATSMVRGKDRKRLTGRGVRYYNMQARKMQNQIARTQFETDIDEGFDDGSAASKLPIVSHMHNAQIARTNRAFMDAVIDDHVAKTRQHSVARTNMENRAKRIHEALSDENARANTQIYQQVTSAFRQSNNPAAGSAEELAIKRSVNDVLADAISQKRRVDSEMKSNYLELYDDSPAGKYVQNQLVEAIKTHDYNSASAAMITMAKRGDHGDLIRTMIDHSSEISDNFAMQKNMADTGLALKNDNLFLWAWAKANMIRRGMSDSNNPSTPDQNVASYIDMATFLKGDYMAGDGAGTHDKLQKASLKQIFEDLSSWGPIASQDRTVFKEMFKLIQDGHIPIQTDANGNNVYPLLFPEKYARSAAASGLMDGEQLATFNKLLTGGYDSKAAQQSSWFYANQGMIEENLMSYVNNMVANQLVNSKGSTIKDINGALLAIHPNDYIEKQVDGRTVKVSSQLYNAFDKQRNALNKQSATNQRSSMNKEIRQMFGINLD